MISKRVVHVVLFAFYFLFYYGEADAKILVMAPHPDDDVLCASGIIYSAMARQEPVRVVYMTNGDLYGGTSRGYLREGEAVNGQVLHLGMSEDNLIFLGYPDGYLQQIYNNYVQLTDRLVTSWNISATYGNRGLGRNDYHFYRFGSHATYNRPNIVADLQDIISSFKPDHIFTTSSFDLHTDHSTTYELLNLALLAVSQNNPTYSPIVHKTEVHTPADHGWPNKIDATSCFVSPNLSGTGVSWNNRESVNVPLAMQSAAYSSNPKYLAISEHASQLQADPSGWLYNFVHKDEFFWTENLLATNQPPVANPGSDQTVQEGAQVRLDGTGSSDPSHKPLTYHWVQTAGASVQLSDPTIASPTFFTPEGLSQTVVLTFQLVVNDGQYSSIPDSVNITVRSSSGGRDNPIASTGADQIVQEGVQVRLNGESSTDPNHYPLTYQWTQTAGVSVQLDNSIAVSPTFVAPAGLGQAAVLTFHLVVSNGQLSSTPASVNITVSPAKKALWSGMGGYACLWTLDTSGTVQGYMSYGPYPGWTAVSYAKNSDGSGRILWVNTNGQAMIWVLDSSDSLIYWESYGPYNGWTPISYERGSDGTGLLLWKYTTGMAEIWAFDSSDNFLAAVAYGPYAGWSPVSVAKNLDGTYRLVWSYSDGEAVIWSLDQSAVFASYQLYGPYSGWTVTSYNESSDGTPRLIWNQLGDGMGGVLVLDANDGVAGALTYGPYSGWTLMSYR